MARTAAWRRLWFPMVCVGLLGVAGWAEAAVARTTASETDGSSFAAATSVILPALGNFSKIKHVVILMMENRAFDNYFGIYCGAKGPRCPMAANDIPANTCIKLYPAIKTSKCIKPFNLTPASYQGLPDLPHTWESSHHALDNGSMDGFWVAESFHNYTFGHYNGSTIPSYWDMAEEFGLSDNFFSSTLTYSLPNHWFLVAGQSPQVLLGSTIASNQNITARHTYLDQANVTPSIEWELDNHPSVSWTYYDYALANYSYAVHDLSGDTPGSAYLTWSPMAAQNESYMGTNPSHFAPRSQFFGDLANGSLSNISWIIPDAKYSDHLPANVTFGENFVGSVVNAVQNSAYWNSTAVFVTWDEYGGWYDHVAPNQIDADGLGFRVPLLVFTPWTTPGYIGHQQLSFDSLLHFVEWRWNLGCLTARDCNATLPLGFFNFNIHRSPTLFAFSNDSVYPYVAPDKGEVANPNGLLEEPELGAQAPDFDWT